MTHISLPTLRRAAAGLLTTTALAAGLFASSGAMATATGFDARMSNAIQTAKADPNYKAIPLQKTDREWFFALSEQLYTKKITKEEYVAAGAKQYPGYEAS